MKNNKILMWVLILVPVGIGGYLLYKYLSGGGKDQKKIDIVPKSAPVVPVRATTPSVFPLKNGSPKNDMVVQLQTMLGVTADGLFGPKTQAALLLQTGKTSIASQSDFDSVIKTLSDKKQADALKAQTSAKGVKAQSIIDAYNNNSSLEVMTLKPFRAERYTMDYNNVMHAVGAGTNLDANTTFDRGSIEMIGVGGSGDVRVKVSDYYQNATLAAGYYLFNPDDITLQ